MREIFFADKLPYEGAGTLIHYDHEPVTVDGWSTCDVREIIHVHEDAWLSEIESWHRELSEQAIGLTRWWWLSLGSRLILWRTTGSFSLKPILFALAVIKLCDRSANGKIWIVDAPDELTTYLSEWSRQAKTVQLTDLRVKTAIGDAGYKFFSAVKVWLKIVRLVVYLVLHATFRRKKKRSRPARLIVSSLILNPNLISTIGDHFFGHMLDNIPGVTSEDVIWKYEDQPTNLSIIRSKLEGMGRRVCFNADLFCWSDLWFALCTGFTITRALNKLTASPPPLRIDGLVTSSFPHYFIANLVIRNFPLSELILYKQFSKLILESGASVIIYPYEEKPAERAMLLAVQDNAPQIRTIGFAHAAYSKGHLYIRRGTRGEPPRPDVLAVTGRLALHQFQNFGVPLEQIVISGSPRHHNVAVDILGSQSKPRKQILFICGLGFEMRIFAALVEKSPNLLDGYELVIRRSYHSWMEEQDAAEARMRAARIVYRCESGDLMTQIDESDIVLFESTSAGFEAVLRGKLVIRLNLGDIIPTSHFNGGDGHDAIKYCHNVNELKKELDQIALLTPSQYAMTIQRQRDLVESLYSPIDQAALSGLLGNKMLH